jgi:hypothetical protein
MTAGNQRQQMVLGRSNAEQAAINTALRSVISGIALSGYAKTVQSEMDGEEK